MQSFVEAEEPGAAAAPICVAGFTDSHWLRQAFGTVAYGFFPARAMDSEVAARLIHSANERVPVTDLELGVRFCATPRRPSVLELHEPEGALEALEQYLADELRDGLVADVYLGYGLPRRSAGSHGRSARALPASPRRLHGSGRV